MYDLEDEDPLREFWNHKHRLARNLGMIITAYQFQGMLYYNPDASTMPAFIGAFVYSLLNILVFLLSCLPNISLKLSYVGWVMLAALSLVGMMRVTHRDEFIAGDLSSVLFFLLHSLVIFICILIVNTHYCDIKYNQVVVIGLYIGLSVGIYHSLITFAEAFKLPFTLEPRLLTAYVLISLMQVYYRYQVIQQAQEHKERINDQKKFKRIFDNLKEPVIISEGEAPVYINDAFLANFEEQIQQATEGMVKDEDIFCQKSGVVGCLISQIRRHSLFNLFRTEADVPAAKFLSSEILELFKDNNSDPEEEKATERINYSLQGIQGLSNLKDKVFQMTNSGQTMYYQIQTVSIPMDNQQLVMMEFLDVSQGILHHQAQQENRFLSMANAFVSHELRNPLQSIIAQNIKKAKLYD